MRRTNPTHCILALVALTACCGLLLNACGHHVSAVGLPSGWTWYHDSALPFEAAVPPGWQVAALDDGPASLPECMHGVDFFAPDHSVDTSFTGQIHGAWQMKIDVDLTCTGWTPTSDSDFTPQAQPVTVGGAQTHLFENAHDDFRAVPVNFGGHSYVFKVHAYESAGETQKVYALFDQMVGFFKYTAGSGQ